MQRSILIIAALLGLLIGYIELRLPVTVEAQGGDAVYERLGVTSTAADALRTAGGLEVEADAAVGGALTVVANADVSGDLAVGGDADVEGGLTVAGAVSLEGFRGLISAFNGECPDGWTALTALRGRFIVWPCGWRRAG